MLKGFLIGIGVLVVIVLLFMFPGGVMSSDDINDYTLSRAYLAKNAEQYARCYSSVNYGTSGLIDVELALSSEYFNNQRVSSEAMKPVQESFMNTVKQKCDRPISDYESVYNKAQVIQEKSENLSVGWRTFIFGGTSQSIPASEVLQYSPARARMSLAFNDYIFTEAEAKVFYMERLGL